MTATPKPEPDPSNRELRLWRVGRTLLLAFAAAVLTAGAVFYGLVVLLDFKAIDTGTKLDAKTLFDLVKLSFGVVAGAGALVALVVAYRRQRVDEAGAHRESTRLHTERFSQAVDKLGSDSPAVRLGGVHALAGLADDAPTQDLRQTCIDVLCAYLRLPSALDPGHPPDPLPDTPETTEEQRDAHQIRHDAHQAKQDHYRALREVRHTILRLIGDHYRIPQNTHRSWQGCNLDLTNVTIDGNIDFNGARFTDGTVDFRSAAFSGSTVHFGGAAFSGGDVDFGRATFTGGNVSFSSAGFTGGTVHFNNATFSGGTVYFGNAEFTGGLMYFGNAEFTGGTVDFGTASGPEPSGLVPYGVSVPLPQGLAVPPAWRQGGSG
ncbi:pentapeptide repeat-containing protein [Streptomyces sp. NPDC021093]|uniref:pentapeptide repeat-containing protein n=1 Tax=Streptomyces sp. NPDC021093 TaxID=3365112 RepID=UPI0037990905